MPNLTASVVETETWASAKFPLGAHIVGPATTIAVFAKHATRVVLELYNKPTGEAAVQEFLLIQNPTDFIWRGKFKNLPVGSFYAFRCWGPNWPYSEKWHRGNSSEGFICDVDAEGNRYNPNKVLFDPYARELSHDKETPEMTAANENGGMYGTGGGDYKGVIRRNVDTGLWAPKGIVIQDSTPTGKRPYLEPELSAIYEAHLRGLTQHPSSSRLKTLLKDIPGFEQVQDIPENLRGTYKGAGMMAPYIKALGFTTIEFLPVHETDNDNNSSTEAKGNYWGYMTFGFFAPDRRFALDKSPGGPTREFREMVKAFHDQGIEVYIDVVYNHTGEGGNWGNRETTGFVSMGGFDVREYYMLTKDHYLVDGATGCGNQLNCSTETAKKLVLDSLTYWVKEMGVDGFRFDLAPVLGRTIDPTDRENWDKLKRFSSEHPLPTNIRDLAGKHKFEVVAEAWDLWGYEVGNFPKGWGEWNGRFRDSVRSFMKGDGNSTSFQEMVNGDYAGFNDQGGPARSINFLVAHDGFTLADLVSYNQKNNGVAWPFGPSDGGNDNNSSWDSMGDPALRRQRLRNFWAIQFVSRGVPLVVWGDEFGRTQNGNNNPYNIDSVATWSNYAMIASNTPQKISTEGMGAYHDNLGKASTPSNVNPIFRFASYMANLRKQHKALKQRAYGDFHMDSGNDVTYLFRKPDGKSLLQGGERCVWLRIDGSAVKDHDLLVCINMSPEMVSFALPPESPTQKWVRLVDTDQWAESYCNCWSAAKGAAIRESYHVNPWSIVILEEVKR